MNYEMNCIVRNHGILCFGKNVNFPQQYHLRIFNYVFFFVILCALFSNSLFQQTMARSNKVSAFLNLDILLWSLSESMWKRNQVQDEVISLYRSHLQVVN